MSDQKESLDPATSDSLDEYVDWLQAADQGNKSVADAIDKTDQWCEDACQKWYGETRRTDPHFGETLSAFRRGEPGAVERMLSLSLKPDELVPPIAATVLSELGTAGVAQAYPTARKILDDPTNTPSFAPRRSIC